MFFFLMLRSLLPLCVYRPFLFESRKIIYKLTLHLLLKTVQVLFRGQDICMSQRLLDKFSADTGPFQDGRKGMPGDISGQPLFDFQFLPDFDEPVINRLDEQLYQFILPEGS